MNPVVYHDLLLEIYKWTNWTKCITCTHHHLPTISYRNGRRCVSVKIHVLLYMFKVLERVSKSKQVNYKICKRDMWFLFCNWRRSFRVFNHWRSIAISKQRQQQGGIHTGLNGWWNLLISNAYFKNYWEEIIGLVEKTRSFNSVCFIFLAYLSVISWFCMWSFFICVDVSNIVLMHLSMPFACFQNGSTRKTLYHKM